jgi:hypothetical protein
MSLLCACWQPHVCHKELYQTCCGIGCPPSGGALGLHKRVWSITKVSAPDYTGAVLTYESPAFEEVGR